MFRGMADASGVGDYHRDHESSALRKAKKQRVPKRGPGVAELEKMLREQEQKDDNGNGIGIGGISSSSSSLVSSLPVTAFHGNGNGISQLGSNGRSKGVYVGGSGVFLPEQTLLPISWGLSSTWKHEEAPKMATGFSFPLLVSNGSVPPPPPPPMVQKNHLSVMDLFPLSAITTTPSSSAGVYHHVEPPSNQKPSPHSYISTLFPEEDKIIGTKRPRPSFTVESWRPAPPRMQPFHSIPPQISRLDALSSSSNNGVFNFGISRDPVPFPTSPLELKVRTYASDHGNPNASSSRPTTIQNCQPDLSKFIHQFPFQENTEGTSLQRPSSSSESDVPVYNKGFFSFLLQPEDLQRGSTSAEASLCLKREVRCNEKTGEFIDLNLKL